MFGAIDKERLKRYNSFDEKRALRRGKRGDTMNATTAFEHRRDALRAQLEQAGDMAEAVRAVTMALEQTACELMQDEQDEYARQRQQAVFALAKRAPQLLRAARAQGELLVRAQESEPAAKLGKAQIAGGLILAALAVAQLADGKLLYAALQAAGAALLALHSLRPQRHESAANMRAVGVLKIDADETLRALAELCAAADVCVSDLALLADAGRVGINGTADEATIDLLVSLMEAKATGKGDVALSSLSQAEQFLTALGVECVFYAPGQEGYFDLLPTLGEERTVRPALLKDGKVLRRGVAARRMERSVNA